MCKVIICACVVIYARFPFICYAAWPYSEKVEVWPFDPVPRVVGEGDLRAKYLLPCRCIHDFL